MFSRISQIGKNLTDELSRNIDEAGSPRPSANDPNDSIDLDSSNHSLEEESDQLANRLPPDVQMKLRKFAKYEQKYPLLLEAYKTEKAKLEQVVHFEKILQENTPCSSITEGEELAQFLNSLNMKNQMLNEEIRRLTKNGTEQDSVRVKELKAKIEDLNKQKDDNSNGRITELSQKLKEQEEIASELSAQVDSLRMENEDKETKITELEAKTKNLNSKVENSAGDKGVSNANDERKDKLDSLETENKILQNRLSQLSEKIETLTKENHDLLKSNSESKEKISKISKNNTDLALEDESLSKKLDELTEVHKAKLHEFEALTESKISLEEKVKELNTEVLGKDASIAEIEKLHNEAKGVISKMKETYTQEVNNKSILSETFEKRESDLQNKIKVLEKIIEDSKSGEKTKRDDNSSAPASTTPPPVTSNNKKKNKKKKGKSSVNQQVDCVKDTEQIIEPNASKDLTNDDFKAKYEDLLKVYDELKTEPESITPDKVDTLNKEIESLRDKYNLLNKSYLDLEHTSKTEVAAKLEELENAKDMLRHIGDDLVTSKDEIKDLKSKHEALLKLSENYREDGTIEKKELEDQINQVKSLKLELEVLRKQHEQVVTDYESEKSESRRITERLTSERTVLQEANEKFNSEIEGLNDKLKKHLNDSNTYDAKIDQLNKEIAEKTQKISQLTITSSKVPDLENSIKISINNLDRANQEIISLKKDYSQTTKAFSALKNEKTKIEQIKYQNEEELTKLKKVETALKKELTVLQNNLNVKEKTIGYFEKQVKEYELNKTQVSEELTRLRTVNRDLSGKLSGVNEQRLSLSNEKIKLTEQLNELRKRVSELENENKRLVDKANVLQDKYDGLQDIKTNSNDELESIRQQCEELSISSKEAKARAEQLEEELSESRTMLQERTREASTIRRLLLENEQNQDSKIKELKSKVDVLLEEKDRIENDTVLALSRKQRAIDDIQYKNDELTKSSEEWSFKEAKLLKELNDVKVEREKLENENRNSSFSSEELNSVLNKLKISLNTAERKVREYETLNNVLKKTNEELTSKVDRITKNYKVVSSQLSMFKERNGSTNSSAKSSPHATRSNSIVSNLNDEGLAAEASSRLRSSNNVNMIHDNGDTTGSKQDQIAYIKNVLLGFLEHKDQRQQLLPVISMLLQLNKGDEKRFLLALR